MKKYTVYMPFTGRVAIGVEAEDEASAIAQAWEADISFDDKDLDIEWEMHEQVCKGNVFYGMQNEVEVEVEVEES